MAWGGNSDGMLLCTFVQFRLNCKGSVRRFATVDLEAGRYADVMMQYNDVVI